DKMLRRKYASPAEIVALDSTHVGKEADDRAVDRVVSLRARRAIENVDLALYQHVREEAAFGYLKDTSRERRIMCRGRRCVDIADPPFERVKRHLDMTQEMAIPDRST